MDIKEREIRHQQLNAKRVADRPRLAAYLLRMVDDASDYQNDFIIPLNRDEIYNIWDALKSTSADEQLAKPEK